MWTTNTKLDDYYEGQKFTRCRDPQGLDSYPSQALFERPVSVRGSTVTELLTTQEGQDA